MQEGGVYVQSSRLLLVAVPETVPPSTFTTRLETLIPDPPDSSIMVKLSAVYCWLQMRRLPGLVMFITGLTVSLTFSFEAVSDCGVLAVTVADVPAEFVAVTSQA